MSSDWSDTLVWFGQILLLLYFYHPIYMIIACTRVIIAHGHLLTLLSPAATIILMFSKVPHLNMSGTELAESYSLGTLVLLHSKLFESPKLLISLPCDILT